MKMEQKDKISVTVYEHATTNKVINFSHCVWTRYNEQSYKFTITRIIYL